MGSFLAKLRKEHNLTQAELGETLKESAFSLKDKQEFFKKKWLKQHVMTIVIVYILWVLFALALAEYDLPVYLVGGIGGFIGVTIYAFFHNRMMAYVEECIYGGK